MKRNMDDLSKFDQNEDGFILDSNPSNSLHRVRDPSASDSPPENDDHTIVAEKGKVAFRDYLHSRDLCVKYPFDTTTHEKFCELCYCYVCDDAAPCKYWKDSESGHCHASGKSDEWNLLRQSIREQHPLPRTMARPRRIAADACENEGNNIHVGNPDNNQHSLPGTHPLLSQMMILLQQQSTLAQSLATMLAQQQVQLQKNLEILSTQSRPELAEFKMLAPSFRGTTDPMDAMIWMEEIEKTFKVMKCWEEDKVIFCTHMLQGAAYDWWKTREAIYQDEVCTWKQFEEDFYEHYFPRSVRRSKQRELLDLTQGSKSVLEYNLEFTRLSKLAPWMVANKELLASSFEEGLNPRIRELVACFELKTHAEVIHKALLVERTISDSRDSDNSKNGKRDRALGGRDGNNFGNQAKRFHPQLG